MSFLGGVVEGMKANDVKREKDSDRADRKEMFEYQKQRDLSDDSYKDRTLAASERAAEAANAWKEREFKFKLGEHNLRQGTFDLSVEKHENEKTQWEHENLQKNQESYIKLVKEMSQIKGLNIHPNFSAELGGTRKVGTNANSLPVPTAETSSESYKTIMNHLNRDGNIPLFDRLDKNSQEYKFWKSVEENPTSAPSILAWQKAQAEDSNNFVKMEDIPYFLQVVQTSEGTGQEALQNFLDTIDPNAENIGNPENLFKGMVALAKYIPASAVAVQVEANKTVTQQRRDLESFKSGVINNGITLLNQMDKLSEAGGMSEEELTDGISKRTKLSNLIADLKGGTEEQKAIAFRELAAYEGEDGKSLFDTVVEGMKLNPSLLDYSIGMFKPPTGQEDTPDVSGNNTPPVNDPPVNGPPVNDPPAAAPNTSVNTNSDFLGDLSVTYEEYINLTPEERSDIISNNPNARFLRFKDDTGTENVFKNPFFEEPSTYAEGGLVEQKPDIDLEDSIEEVKEEVTDEEELIPEELNKRIIEFLTAFYSPLAEEEEKEAIMDEIIEEFGEEAFHDALETRFGTDMGLEGR